MAVIKILSLDGGGTKGLFQLHFLNLLEKRMKKPIRDIFQYIGGTSIGGINALFLTHPIKWFGYRDDFFIQEIIDSDLPNGFLKLFFSPPPYLVKSIGILDARYSYQMDVIDHGLKAHILGADPFGLHTKTRCMIFAHNAALNQIKAFKSWKHQEYYLYVVARATSAAPVFFSPVCIGEDVFVDGALAGANNPTPFIVYEAKLYHPNDEFVIVSLGAGSPDLNFKCSEISKGSLSQWARSFVALMLNAADRSFEYLSGRHEFEGEKFFSVEHILKNDAGYCGYYKSDPNITFRFKPNINASIDNIEPNLLEQTKRTAEQIFEEEFEIIDALVEQLSR